MNVLWHLLLALIMVIALGAAITRALRPLGQPAVIGEMLAGILLGPSLLGRLAPGMSAALFPVSILPWLGWAAQLGVTVYMFIVGLELNLDQALAPAGRRAISRIAAGSMALPFLLGAALALWLFPRYSNGAVTLLNFCFFMGVALSITAFPVLARMLHDLGLDSTPLGGMALACAAVTDAAAWCLLALMTALLRSNATDGLWVFTGLAAFLTVMACLRPWLAQLSAKTATPLSLALMLAGALFSAAVTDRIGVHALFGAFVLGALIPSTSPLARGFIRRLRGPVSVLLLPAFFAFSGLRTQIGLVQGWPAWAACAGLIVVATAGKFGGTSLSAWSCGYPWKDSAALGMLMNTRGLVELIVLGVGLDLGVLSVQLFSMLVLMALVTTFSTVPALRLFAPEALARPGNAL